MTGRGELPEPIIRAFADRPSLPIAETAAILGMDPKTLRGHIKAGHIGFLTFGAGTKRARLHFTLAQVSTFLEAQATDFTPKVERIYVEKNWRLNQPKTSVAGAHVYFIRTGRYVKIGTARNVAKRLASLQIAHPEELDLVFCIPGGGVEEAALHLKFLDDRVRGEWFVFSPQIQEWIAEQRIAGRRSLS